MAASRFLWNQDRFQALPAAERTAPSERGPAVLAPAPSVILERDARGSTHPARSRCGPLDATPPALVVDLGFEPLGRFLRIPGEGQSRQVIAFREDVLGLPKEDADLGRAEVVGLRLLQAGLARVDDRLGLLDLRLTELHRPLDLSLLTFHGEPITVEEVAPSLPRVFGQGDRGTEVRGLANRISGEGEQIPHPVRLPLVGHLRGPDEVLQEGIIQELTLEEHVSGALKERAGGHGLRVLRITRL